LNAGASVEFSFEDRVIYTPLQLTCQKSANMRMVRLLLSFGCNPNHLALWAEDQQQLEGFETSWCRRYTAAPPQTVVQLNDLELARLLLEHGAQPDILSANIKQTALQVAVQNRNTDIMNLLMEYGADVNFAATGNGGVTALQLAAETGHLGMAILLVEKWADVNAARSGISSCTALEAAAANGKIDMVRFLKNVGVDLSETAGQYKRALILAFDHGFLGLRRELSSWLN
jgi:ankyrin repeat protein